MPDKWKQGKKTAENFESSFKGENQKNIDRVKKFFGIKSDTKASQPTQRPNSQYGNKKQRDYGQGY